MAFARKTQTLGFLNSHALLILTESSKFKNQVVHEETFENTLGSLCQVSPGVTFCHWIFCFNIVRPLMQILALLSMLCVCQKLEKDSYFFSK